MKRLITLLGILILIFVSIFVFMPMEEKDKVIVGIEIFSPNLNESILMPLEISGRINGNGWNGFEGQVGTVKLLDKNGKELSSTYLPATTDWMSLPTDFKASLDFQSEEEQVGSLLFHNENASGLPEYDKTYSLQVKIPKTEIVKIAIYFGNMALSSSSEKDECLRVYPVYRYINKTQSIARATIEELLKGPTESEETQGYFTNIPIGSKLNNISIVDKVAKADFNNITESGGGSCSMSFRTAQINNTLKQFSTIVSTELSVEGRTGDIFQP